DARSGVADADLDAIPGARRRDGDRAAGRRRLNSIGDEIAVHAPEREPIALDDERAVGVVRADLERVALGFRAHRIDDFADRSVDVHREALDRLRLHDVAQVLHEALQRAELAFDGAPEQIA